MREIIPAEMRRQCRQKYGFKCVICGIPHYQIHHIEEYAIVKEHKLENLVPLCPNHHEMLHKGSLSKQFLLDKIKNFDSKGWTASQELMLKPLKIILGNNEISEFTGASIICNFLGELYMTLKKTENDDFLINFIAKRKGKTVFSIIDNELSHTSDIWDVEVSGTSYILREKARDILLNLTLNKNDAVIVYAKIDIGLNNKIVLDDRGISFGNNVYICNNTISKSQGGVIVLDKSINKCGTAARGYDQSQIDIRGAKAKRCDIAFYDCMRCRECEIEECQIGFYWELKKLKIWDN
jgi:trigger factor